MMTDSRPLAIMSSVSAKAAYRKQQ